MHIELTLSTDQRQLLDQAVNGLHKANYSGRDLTYLEKFIWSHKPDFLTHEVVVISGVFWPALLEAIQYKFPAEGVGPYYDLEMKLLGIEVQEDLR